MTSTTPSVLIIEDDPVIRKVVGGIFNAADWRVVEASNGDHALQIVATEHIDLAILDLAMPVLDGYAFMDCLNQDSMRPDLPIVLLTSQTLTASDKNRFRGRVALMIEKRSGENGMHQQLETVARAYK